MALPRTTPLLVAAGLLAGGVIAAGALTATGALAVPSATQPPAPPSGQAGQPGHGYGGQSDADGNRMGGPGRGPGHAGGFGGGFGRGLGGDLLHGEMVVKTPTGVATRLVQHGSVTANAGGTVTVRSTDGFTVVWTVGSSTSIRAGRTAETVKDLAVGDEVTASGAKTSAGGDATFIAERPAGMPAGPGKTAPSGGSAPAGNSA